MADNENKAPRPPVQVPAELKDEEAPKRNVFEETEKDLAKVAAEVLAGEWGEGDALREKLRLQGFDHREVRAEMVSIVNQRAGK